MRQLAWVVDMGRGKGGWNGSEIGKACQCRGGRKGEKRGRDERFGGEIG